MLLLRTVSVEYLKGYDDIVCELALCTFNLVISQQKESACKKTIN